MGSPLAFRATAWLWLVLAAPSGAAPAPADFTPKVVLQAGPKMRVLMTTWTPDGKAVLSLDISGTIVVWDAATGHIVNYVRLPLTSSIISQARSFAFTDKKTVRVSLDPSPACPTAAVGFAGVCSFDFDPATGHLTPVAVVVAVPELPVFGGRPSAWRTSFARSPDGMVHTLSTFRPNAQADTHERDDGSRIKLVSKTGSLIRTLQGSPPSAFRDIDLSRDGKTLVLLEDPKPELLILERLNLVDGTSSTGRLLAPGDYRHVRWLDGERYLVQSHGYLRAFGRARRAGVAPAVLLDSDCAESSSKGCLRIEAHGMMRPLGANGFVGTGSIAECTRADVGDLQDGVDCPNAAPWHSLEFFTRPTAAGATEQAAWVARPIPELAALKITALEVSPDGTQIVVAAESTAAGRCTTTIVSVGAAPAAPVRVLWSTTEPAPAQQWQDPPVNWLAFAPDGSQVMFVHQSSLVILDLTGGKPARTHPYDNPMGRRVVTDGRHALDLDRQNLIDLESGQVLGLNVGGDAAWGAEAAHDVNFYAPYVLKAGFVEGKPILWTAAGDGVVHFYHSTTGAELMRLYVFPNNRYFAVTPEGRYDTNLGPDTNEVRWWTADAPWQSVAPQMFMRDLYEPKLISRLFQCTVSSNCARVFKPLRSPDRVNRVLPQVKVASVVAGAEPGTVDVCVEATDIVEPDGRGVPTHSGLHDLRLFRNGRLVDEMRPAPAELNPDDIQAWRNSTALKSLSCPSRDATFTVQVSSKAGGSFSAYAFNDDRIKGETSSAVSAPRAPPAAGPSRPPLAYVVAIGVNTYVNMPDHSLQFAASDAHLISRALGILPGRNVVTVELTSDGAANHATKTLIHAVFDLLAGRRVAENRASLKLAGVDGSAIERATPDDALIVTYSGHGWADERGNFFLLPSDTRRAAGAGSVDDAPEVESMISSAELTEWLRRVDTLDMAIVIDACHSAASVVEGQFKPGPMGDPGLGELAYDKGIRILAAAQADDVALEDSSLHQGLLTFALAGKGEALSRAGAPSARTPGEQARTPGEQPIFIDQWLRYAVRRVPELSGHQGLARLVTGADGARGFTLVHAAGRATLPHIQEPSLFDFTNSPSPVMLRSAAEP